VRQALPGITGPRLDPCHRIGVRGSIRSGSASGQVTPPSHAAKSRRQVTPPSHAAKSRRQVTPPRHAAKSHRQVTPPSHTAKSHRQVTPRVHSDNWHRQTGCRSESAKCCLGSQPHGWIRAISSEHVDQSGVDQHPAKPLRPSHSGQATPAKPLRPSYSAKLLRQFTPPSQSAK
jgi:hypothetical protein